MKSRVTTVIGERRTNGLFLSGRATDLEFMSCPLSDLWREPVNRDEKEGHRPLSTPDRRPVALSTAVGRCWQQSARVTKSSPPSHQADHEAFLGRQPGRIGLSLPVLPSTPASLVSRRLQRRPDLGPCPVDWEEGPMRNLLTNLTLRRPIRKRQWIIGAALDLRWGSSLRFDYPIATLVRGVVLSLSLRRRRGDRRRST